MIPGTPDPQAIMSQQQMLQTQAQQQAQAKTQQMQANQQQAIQQAAQQTIAPTLQAAQPQQTPQMTFNPYAPPAPKPYEATYNKMIEQSGGPTQDMLEGLGAYGRPDYLTKSQQQRAVNNRQEDINGLYKEMLGREGDGEGLNFWTNTGKNAEQLRQDFANSPEYRGIQADKQMSALLADPGARFDRENYLAQRPDVAAAGVDPYQHYMNHGKNEGTSPFNQSAVANELRNQTYTAPPSPKSQLGAISYTPEQYANALSKQLRSGTYKNVNGVLSEIAGGGGGASSTEIDQLRQEIEQLRSASNNDAFYNYYTN